MFGFIPGNVGHRAEQTDGKLTRKAVPWQPSEATPEMIEGYLKAQQAKTTRETALLVIDYGLPYEALNTDHLGEAEMWAA